MDLISAAIYGVIQGITEFAPVSSSGHLALLPHFMHIEDPGVFFDLMMHLGTAFAVIIYFRWDILRYIQCLFPALFKWNEQHRDYFFIRNFCFSTFATVVMIFIIKDFAKTYGRTPSLIAINLAFFGLILFLTDRKENNDAREISPMEENFSWRGSLIIGISQAFAIFPGVSRSGITMSAARLMGLSRKEASSFSFLLSLPIIFAGIIYKIPEYSQTVASGESLGVLLVGIFVSFIFGLLTIHYFIKLISKVSFMGFFVYRVLLAALLFMTI